MSFVRCILHCDDENLILASRAVQYMLQKPEKRDALLIYGVDENAENRIEMYAKRLKKSIRVQQVKP